MRNRQALALVTIRKTSSIYTNHLAKTPVADRFSANKVD